MCTLCACCLFFFSCSLLFASRDFGADRVAYLPLLLLSLRASLLDLLPVFAVGRLVAHEQRITVISRSLSRAAPALRPLSRYPPRL